MLHQVLYKMLNRLHQKTTHGAICLAVIVVFLVGLATPAMGVGCQCPCCGMEVNGHYQDPHGGASHTTDCNHCTLNPMDSPDVAVTPPSLVTQHLESPVRLATAATSGLVDRGDGIYGKTSTISSICDTAPIYLQTLSIRR